MPIFRLKMCHPDVSGDSDHRTDHRTSCGTFGPLAQKLFRWPWANPPQRIEDKMEGDYFEYFGGNTDFLKNVTNME